ncbi:amidohydrolase [Alkalilacustris brevis]|uniref:amidohydrolase n=1 Tax=Alkalilacustris brevis TaxID=2026338 RepID=UPI000E0DABB3|nr:amidohydrolase [Alkalilacustris brevis]
MPVHNAIAELAPKMTEWRHHLHRHPEIGFDCHETAAFIVARLREMGITEIHEGIAQSGIVAIIEGQAEGPTVGLRADMDALPIEEATGAPYASTVPGRMHACGHDGHTTMLLGAAGYLAQTRRFAGRVALIFQPAEESAGGAGVMVREGIMERFDIAQVYALHNAPYLPEGMIAISPGAVMAAVDTAWVNVTGRGGHGAHPEATADPIAAGMAMAQAFQSIVARNRRGTDDLVISVTQFHAGSADNIIPDKAWFCATVRSFDPAVQEMVQKRMAEIVAGHAAAYGVEAVLDYDVGYPATINDPARAAFVAEVAAEVAGPGAVLPSAPTMGAEDFSYMLQARPGAYLFLGAGREGGSPAAGLHHPAFDFNDAVAPLGASLLARLAERALPVA